MFIDLKKKNTQHYSLLSNVIDLEAWKKYRRWRGKYQASLLESNNSIIKKIQMNGSFEAYETTLSRHRKEFFDSLGLILVQSTPDGQMVFRYNEGFTSGLIKSGCHYASCPRLFAR